MIQSSVFCGDRTRQQPKCLNKLLQDSQDQLLLLHSRRWAADRIYQTQCRQTCVGPAVCQDTCLTAGLMIVRDRTLILSRSSVTASGPQATIPLTLLCLCRRLEVWQRHGRFLLLKPQRASTGTSEAWDSFTGVQADLIAWRDCIPQQALQTR